MNLNWITEPITMYGAMACGCAAALHLFISSKAELRRQALRHEAQTEEMLAAIGQLETRIATLAEEAEQEARSRAAIAAGAAPRALNVQKRSEALRMCRRGADRDAIATRLGLSKIEVHLLEKVQDVLKDSPADYAVGSPHERSRILEYSLEA